MSTSVSTVAESTSRGDAALAESARYLTFTLNGEGYALDIFHVTEILEHRHLTVVPMMPDFIRGVINLRGRAVPVIDLAIRFARGATTIGRRTSIIIVHISDPAAATDGHPSPGESGTGGQDIGILVDTVNKVEEFSEEDIEPAPAFGAGIRADYIAGMARRDNDFIIVLDINHVLSIGDMLNAGAAAEAAGALVVAETAGAVAGEKAAGAVAGGNAAGAAVEAGAAGAVEPGGNPGAS